MLKQSIGQAVLDDLRIDWGIGSDDCDDVAVEGGGVEQPRSGTQRLHPLQLAPQMVGEQSQRNRGRWEGRESEC